MQQGQIMEKMRQRQTSESDSEVAGKPAGGDTAVVSKKENFEDPFSAHTKDMARRRSAVDHLAKSSIDTKSQEMIDKANAALSNQTGLKEDMKEFEEQMKISDEDVSLAEQVIFKGYAETDVTIPNLPGHKFTLCTTSAEDMSVIDEIIYDMIRGKENDKGDVDLPAQHVQTMKSALFLAMGFKGIGGKDFCDEPIHQIMTIKRAVVKLKELEYAGEMSKVKDLSDSLKKSVKYRAIRIRRYPTPVIDFLSQKKFEFDNKMYTIMISEKLLPKSSGQSRGTQDLSSSTAEESSSSAQ